MSLRKKIFVSILAFLIFPSLVLAVQLENPIKAKTFGELIEKITNFIFTVALALAPLLIVIAGFYFVTASGDPAKIETGKDIIKYTLIGLLIILLSKGLITLIKQVLGVQ